MWVGVCGGVNDGSPFAPQLPITIHATQQAFFLNLYTTGILLARLILGPPPANAALKWCGYYTSAAVEALGDLFSLAEVRCTYV